MDSEDVYQAPFDTTDSTTDLDSAEASAEMAPTMGSELDAKIDAGGDQYEDVTPDDMIEIEAARTAFETDNASADQVHLEEPADRVEDSDESEMDDPQAVELANPFVQSWNTLVSTTNWEKGRIIGQWRMALVDAGAEPVAYSDAAWVRRVGGVTAPHVGRLRRVYEQFADTFESYDGLFWTHFLAAMEWDDAPLWLEGAVAEGWSVSKMRDARWRAMGAVDSKRPTASEIIEVDLDEDAVLPSDPPAGREDNRREYDGDGPGAAGPKFDDPDFGDADELVSLAGNESANSPTGVVKEAEVSSTQPFRDLPDLPDDLSDAVETLKLAILRHKTSGWNDVTAETLDRYLKAIAMLLT